MSGNMNISNLGGKATDIGGIKFNEEDVLSKTARKTSSKVNGKPLFEYTVQTSFGTFTYNDSDVLNLKNDPNKQASIFKKDGKVIIDNCNLREIKGTQKSDTYIVSDSYVHGLDVQGDPQNQDTIILTGQSNLARKRTDNNDVITDLTTGGAPMEPVHFNIKM
ncbi:hypothetical protein IJ541_05790 [bacterium]|nr:hypothetical protein [bacterium]